MARPTHKHLATPTDLAQSDIAIIAAAVNPCIADTFALYIKAKNFHWHMTGSHFRDYHLLMDDVADTVFKSIDPMAERLRRIGATTLLSIGHVSKLQNIKDNNEEWVDPEHMLTEIRDDLVFMAGQQRKACEVCADKRDHASSSLFEEIIDETERLKWFVHQHLEGNRKNID